MPTDPCSLCGRSFSSLRALARHKCKYKIKYRKDVKTHYEQAPLPFLDEIP